MYIYNVFLAATHVCASIVHHTITKRIRVSTKMFACAFKLKERLAETVEGSTLSLECVDNVHCSNGLSASVFSVCDCITDNVFKEALQNVTGFFVDLCANTLDTTSSCQTADCWLGDTLNVITENLLVSLCTTLTKTFATLTSARHV